jgi:hypothetical protein
LSDFSQDSKTWKTYGLGTFEGKEKGKKKNLVLSWRLLPERLNNPPVRVF